MNRYIIFILILGAFLRFEKLDSLMPFIGDQGWFYLSARDMILTGNIPLVGITSSHTWLHQGPLWTYMLAAALFVSNLNPLSGVILSSLIGTITIFIVYRIGSDFFSAKVGLAASLLYATSPLVIIHARMPYHTSPIPVFVALLFYSLLKVLRGKSMYFPIVILCLSLLYNFELATVVFFPSVLLVLGLGIYKREKWVRPLKSRKIIILSMAALLAPMVPILIYDFKNGFPQTLRFGAWLIYKGFQTIGFIEKSNSEPFLSVVAFFINKLSLLIFAPNAFVSIIILFATLVFSTITIWKRKEFFSPLATIFLLTTIGTAGFFAAGARSEAYLPMLFPGIVLSVSFLAFTLYKINKYTVLIIIAVAALNVVFIYQNNYFVDRFLGYGSSLTKRIDVAKTILKLADSQEYNIEGRGPGSEFESFTTNYEYLLWWLGDSPSREKQELIFVIEEKQNQIDVKIK